jgi:hypothetical protein
MVKTFGDYIKSVGVDIYLDAEDEELKAAVDAEDHRRITEYIEVGIRNSTDVLVFLSDRTKETWWVPYEIGFGKADGKDLRCVKLKKVDCSRLSFLTIVDVLQTRRQFARYVDEVRKRQEENEPLLEREGRVGVVTKLLDLLREIEYDSPTGGGRLAEYLDE